MLLFLTLDGRWRVYQSKRRPGFDLAEVAPGGATRIHLEDVTLAEVGEFLAAHGVRPDELSRP